MYNGNTSLGLNSEKGMKRQMQITDTAKTFISSLLEQHEGQGIRVFFGGYG
jgi:hypothetical protein